MNPNRCASGSVVSHQWLSLSIAGVLIIVAAGCSSSWDYVERAPGKGKVAILKHPQTALPAFGEDYSSILKANAQVAQKGSVDFSRQSVQTLRELFDKQDQGNAQLRNFLVTAYAIYINGEFELNAENRDHARQLWSSAVLMLQQRAFESRELGLERDQQVERVRATVAEALRGVTGLGLEGAQGRQLRAKLEVEVPKLISLERAASLPPSDTAVVGSALLAFTHRDYYTAIEKVPTLRTISPDQLYLLASAYVRACQADPGKECEYSIKARQANETLLSVAALSKDSQLLARGLNQLGVLESRNTNDVSACSNFVAAIKLDPSYSTAWYNLGCRFCRAASANSPTNKDIVLSLQCLNKYRILAGLTPEEAVSVAEADGDNAYTNLFAAFTDKAKVADAISNSKHPETPPE